jgi:outer membrane lipoprotein-sorting protein
MAHREDSISWRDASDGLRFCFCPQLSRPAPSHSRPPLDLTAPAVAAQKSAKSPKTAAPAPIPAAEAVARANAWLDAARVMTADFVQIGPDGRRSEGELSLVRPGRMRFEYTEPARLEVVAYGRSVAIINRKLNTQDEYFIGQTPLTWPATHES